VIGEQLGALVLHDYGLFMALTPPVRDSLVDTLRVAIVNWALDFLDSAQQIQAEKVFLGQVVSESIAELDPAKQRWLNDPAFAGARTFVEHLWRDGYDHIEVVFALALIYEPLFGRFARQEYFYRLAPLHGDHLTPQVLWPSFRSADAASTWTRELFDRILGNDPEFGFYNRQLMAWWTQRWLARAVDAVADFSTLFASTELSRTGQPESPRRIFEALAVDWVRDIAPIWDSDHTTADLLGLYDKRVSGGSAS
jgi:hypothetical protein